MQPKGGNSRFPTVTLSSVNRYQTQAHARDAPALQIHQMVGPQLSGPPGAWSTLDAHQNAGPIFVNSGQEV